MNASISNRLQFSYVKAHIKHFSFWRHCERSAFKADSHFPTHFGVNFKFQRKLMRSRNKQKKNWTCLCDVACELTYLNTFRIILVCNDIHGFLCFSLPVVEAIYTHISASRWKVNETLSKRPVSAAPREQSRTQQNIPRMRLNVSF